MMINPHPHNIESTPKTDSMQRSASEDQPGSCSKLDISLTSSDSGKESTQCGGLESTTRSFDELNVEPRWKASLCSKKSGKDRGFVQSGKASKVSKLSKVSPKVRDFMKSVVREIRQDMLASNKPSTNSKNVPTQQPIRVLIDRVADSQVIKPSCYRGMLIEGEVDNDVPSDDEDLRLGVRYMYGELLYSVGAQIVKARESGHKQ